MPQLTSTALSPDPGTGRSWIRIRPPDTVAAGGVYGEGGLGGHELRAV